MSNVGLVAIQRTKSYALGVQFMKTSISWAPRRDSRSILPPVSNMQWLGILRNSLEWPSINYQPLTFLLCKVQPVVDLVKSSLSYCFCTIRGDVAYFSPMNWLAKSQQDISNTWCYMTSKQNTAIQLPGWSQWHVIVSFKSNESGWLLAATRRALAFRPELGEAEIEMCISIQIACVWRLQLKLYYNDLQCVCLIDSSLLFLRLEHTIVWLRSREELLPSCKYSTKKACLNQCPTNKQNHVEARGRPKGA